MISFSLMSSFFLLGSLRSFPSSLSYLSFASPFSSQNLLRLFLFFHPVFLLYLFLTKPFFLFIIFSPSLSDPISFCITWFILLNVISMSFFTSIFIEFLPQDRMQTKQVELLLCDAVTCFCHALEPHSFLSIKLQRELKNKLLFPAPLFFALQLLDASRIHVQFSEAWHLTTCIDLDVRLTSSSPD